MKNTVKLLAALITAFTMATTTFNAKTRDLDSTKFVIDGKVLKSHKGKNLKCKVELFYNNTVIDSSVIRMNKPFKYNLKRNVWYTVRITKEGYLPILISFNTEVKDNVKIKENTFYFETNLIHLEDAENMNREFIDFPIGMVEVNPKTGKFETIEVFTKNYLASINTKYKYSDETLVKK